MLYNQELSEVEHEANDDRDSGPFDLATDNSNDENDVDQETM